MHPPSPQLLRALRTSITSDFRQFHPRLSSSPCRKYSSATHRPSQIAPRRQPAKPQSHDRGPKSEEKTQTDFTELNVLGNLPTPATAVDACLDDGFHLDNGVKITKGDGVLLVAGEAFAWRPWQSLKQNAQDDVAAKTSMVNAKGQFEIPEDAWGLLSVVWPRPGESTLLLLLRVLSFQIGWLIYFLFLLQTSSFWAWDLGLFPCRLRQRDISTRWALESMSRILATHRHSSTC
jgi:hypothetical protein